MISKKNILLGHIAAFIIMSIGVAIFNLFVKTIFHNTTEIYIRTTILAITIIGIAAAVLCIKEMMNWEKINGKIYPIYKKEGFSTHFFQVAEEYGETITDQRIHTTYWLNLLCYYQSMGQHDKALRAFTKVDAAYIHSIKNERNAERQVLVKLFFNNGLSVCLKTDNLEDAKRIYRDGLPFLQKYKKNIAILDTLAEYHFKMQEYEQAAVLYEELLEKTGVPGELVKEATERLHYSREQCQGNRGQE